MMKRIGLLGKSLTAAADENRDARRAGAATPAETISDLRVILAIALSLARAAICPAKGDDIAFQNRTLFNNLGLKELDMHDVTSEHWHEPKGFKNAGYGAWKRPNTPYDDFMESQGIPIYRGIG